MRPTYCLELAYDGSSFFGWQSQPHGNTVQDVIESALAILLGEKVRLVSASRTDTGVHAAQQFAIFRVSKGTIPSNDLPFQLHKLLPDTIKVRSMFKVSDDFHPRIDAKTKIYCYRLFIDGTQNSGIVKRHWRLHKPIDIDRLRSELAELVGTHDFTSFCASGGKITTCVRTIDAIIVEEEKNTIRVIFKGPGFLKQMIRIIMGCAVAASGKSSKTESLSKILAGKNRKKAALAAPAEGLTLEQILY
jgi:tRNA pseudouridine38-40 synthase